MWHVKVHSQRLPCPWKDLKEIPVGVLYKPSPSFPFCPQTLLICHFAWRLEGKGQLYFLSAWDLRAERFQFFLRHFPSPDQCHVVCCGLHPDCFLFGGAQLCQDGSLVEEVMCLVTGLLIGNAHCLLSERRTHTVLSLWDSLALSLGWTNCSHFQHKALSISYSIRSLQVFFF